MNLPIDLDRPRAPVAATSRILAGGTAAAAVCFVVGFVLALLGGPAEPVDPFEPGQLVAALVALRPAAWSALGVVLLLLTPVCGLVTSYLEMRAHEPRAAWIALGVLGVLGAATVVALASR